MIEEMSGMQIFVIFFCTICIVGVLGMALNALSNIPSKKRSYTIFYLAFFICLFLIAASFIADKIKL